MYCQYCIDQLFPPKFWEAFLFFNFLIRKLSFYYENFILNPFFPAATTQVTVEIYINLIIMVALKSLIVTRYFLNYLLTLHLMLLTYASM